MVDIRDVGRSLSSTQTNANPERGKIQPSSSTRIVLEGSDVGDRSILVGRTDAMTLRLERGLTQEQLAEGADVHPTFISNLERGYSAPTLHTLLRLATALEVRPGELVDGLKP